MGRGDCPQQVFQASSVPLVSLACFCMQEKLDEIARLNEEKEKLEEERKKNEIEQQKNQKENERKQREKEEMDAFLKERRKKELELERLAIEKE